jgi:hypothetical protein
MFKKRDRGARDSNLPSAMQSGNGNYYNSSHAYILVISIPFSDANPCASLFKLQINATGYNSCLGVCLSE